MKITRGRVETPVRGTFYGTEGIGKTTLAAQCPGAIVLDTEDGSHHLDVARVSCPDWLSFTDAMHELTRDPQGFQTVVIDSADWLERLLIEHILKRAGKKSIEDFGFGKGFTHLAEGFGRLLASCDGLVGLGFHVVFVAHATVKRTSPPDLTDGYDRYELKLTKQTAPLLKEWCDALLFCNYDTRTTEGSDGRRKAVGGKRRMIHAERAAAWDAKNRYGLEAEVPMTIDALAPIFAEPAKRPTWRDRVAAAATVADLGQIGDDADQAVSDGRLTPELRARLDEVIAARHAEIEAGEEVQA